VRHADPRRPEHPGGELARGSAAKCAACKAPISARYPAVELLTGALSVLVAWRIGYSGALIPALVFAWSMVALAFIDFDTQLLPDDITLPLLWLGLLANAFGAFVDLRSAVFGAASGVPDPLARYWGFRILAGKEGMGFGDFKLLAAIGAWTGWQVLPFVILVSASLGAVIGGIGLALARQGRDTRIPFGPFLAFGGIAGCCGAPGGGGMDRAIPGVSAHPVPGRGRRIGITGGIGSGKSPWRRTCSRWARPWSIATRFRAA
jgi:leader peptidase (prepilin peptidase)/N-methyltransferase